MSNNEKKIKWSLSFQDVSMLESLKIVIHNASLVKAFK